ncbi:reverse transcriptase [Plakobranchus ocellatus]|uniref:Reverse transcriptase n=1 Tax=Plakobranchus ocellatus TaxID=259542 RepID=A0AAV3Y5T7_9GAST|nr:reverse transcriptase [Plakobranchus ocellatus]
MEYPCICGKRFSTEKGMKIHSTKMKCVDKSKDRQQRSAQSDRMSENIGQNGGLPEVWGRLEHATMIWEAIQRAKLGKRNLDIVWLGLANA